LSSFIFTGDSRCWIYPKVVKVYFSDVGKRPQQGVATGIGGQKWRVVQGDRAGEEEGDPLPP